MNGIKTFTAEVLYPSANILGENPVWNSSRESICWIDIEQMKLFEFSFKNKNIHQWTFTERVGMLVLDENFQPVLGLQNKLVSFDINTTRLEILVELENELPNNRPNDGKCDIKGRLWVGTMDVHAKENSGSLYCINNNEIDKKISNLTIANGKAWSPDAGLFYFTDSYSRKIDAYYFDTDTGSIIFHRSVIVVPEYLGLPDGITIDEEGMLWVAHWGGASVCRWNPENGALLAKVDLPVPNVTSCEFGGKNLDTLFITTAKTGISEKNIKKYPSSGHLFSVKTGVNGMNSNLYKYNNI